MPIYIVRWPSFSVSLVRAPNEDDLMDVLDEVADPGACRWAVYRGPLWIDLDLPVRIHETKGGKSPPSVADVQVEGAEELLGHEELPYRVSPGDCETGGEMVSAVTKWAFPNLGKLFDRMDDTPLSKKELAAAIRSDAIDFLKYAWRAAHVSRGSDFKSALLTQLGLTRVPPWLKHILDSKESPE
jgi:hypothetical protein